jgi:dienelactone hydrolase
MKHSRLLTILCGAALAVACGAGAAQAELKKQWIDYKQGNTALYGYLVYDDAISGKRPGVLVAHARSGMAESVIRDAEMIARYGYVVFAEDIFGKGILPKDIPEMTAQTVIYNQDRPLMRSRATAGFDVLKANPLVDAAKIAVVGYCFGGTVAVELAETGVPIVGMVSVHGSFRNFMPEAAKNIKGRVLILHGADDPVAPLEEVNKQADAVITCWARFLGLAKGDFSPDTQEKIKKALSDLYKYRHPDSPDGLQKLIDQNKTAPSVSSNTPAPATKP